MYFALVDCNNFYASCERVFDPSLKKRPLVILSNNDGCVIARSSEAKEAGISMGVPEFKIRPILKNKNIAVRSSNYALYGDMSRRVMETLASVIPNMEVYSIDEAFAEIEFRDEQTIFEIGREVRDKIIRHTGIPVSVGIAPTKTLAKLANETAKTVKEYDGVLFLNNERLQDKVLKKTPVSDVWGIGRNYSVMLDRHGVVTAYDLCNKPDSWIRSVMKVTGLRTAWELRGVSCLQIEECTDTRKGILSSRSFGKPVKNREDIYEAVSTFAVRAAEKLRAQHSVASNITVTLVTGKYNHPDRPYKFGHTITLANPTASSSVLGGVAAQLAMVLFQKDRIYKKAWVMLTGIIPQSEIQQDLFSESAYSKKEFSLMETLDKVNAKFGRRTLIQASTGISQDWQMKQQYLSKRYTTQWDELMIVKV